MKINNHQNNNFLKTKPLLRKDIAHYNPLEGCGLCEAVGIARAECTLSIPTLSRGFAKASPDFVDSA
jgi:hypothetical protein